MSVAYGSLGCVIEWCLLSLAGPWGTNRPGVPASIRPRGELVWGRAFEAKDDQRQRVMKYNALRTLFQID
jgi:hypothetical protein